MARGDRWAPVVLLAFGLIALEEGMKLRFGSVARPGAGFFPVVLAAAFSLVCLALAVTAFRSRGGEVAAAPPLGWGKVSTTMIGLLAYAVLLEPAGFVLATFALLLFFFKGLEGQRWPVALGGSLLTALVTYLVFKVWLKVQLPAGPWGL